MQSDHYAIVIGINYYPNHNNNIDTAHNDARAFESWLLDTQGGCLPRENVHELLLSIDSKEDIKPVQKCIDNAIKSLFMKASENEGAERIYLFFSGHGVSTSGLDVQLCMSDWDEYMSRKSTISASLYSDFLYETGFSERFLFLDCCRTSTSIFHQNPPMLDSPQMYSNKGNEGYFHAFAAKHGKAAYFPLGVKKSDKSTLSYFTQAVLEGLRGAAQTESGQITTSNLKAYIESRTSLLASENDVEQTAQVKTDWANLDITEVPASKSISFKLDLESIEESSFIIWNEYKEASYSAEENEKSIKVSLPQGDYEVLNTERQNIGFISVVHTLTDNSLIKVSR